MLLIDLKQLGFKAFTISFLFHLLCLNIFIFTFPIKEVKPKPFFIFLGSILQKHDLDISTTNKQPMRAQTKDLHDEGTGLLFFKTEKPSFSSRLQSKIKNYTRGDVSKITDTRIPDKQSTNEIKDKNQLYLEIPEYEPLKLQTK